MNYRLGLLTIFGTLAVAGPAHAERQTYNPYAMGVTYQELERAQALQQRQQIQQSTGLPVTTNRYSRRTNTRISPEEQYQVLTIEENFKKRFPVHPGLYRDAYDRGVFKKHSTGGNNPGDRWW